MSAVGDFRIAIPDDEVEQLRATIRRTRWPDQVEGAGWSYGTDIDYLRAFAATWADAFDWRAREAELNRLDQYRAELSGTDAEPTGVHFVHRRGVGPDPLPLVLTHGWPSTYLEFEKVIAPLADPGAHGGDPTDAFHVVVPSLPGYGFSDIPRRPGMTPRRMAALWVQLMGELGYPRFAAQGCDWGAYVTALLGLDHPEALVGIHMGMLNFRAPRPEGYVRTPEDDEHAARTARWRSDEAGYSIIQGTKPQSLAYALTDSPVGLAAWILEKWRTWSDCDGDLESMFTREELLTLVSVYWFTRTINSANRLYYESRAHPVALVAGQRVLPPAGFLFERPRGHTIGPPPRARADEVYDVRRWTVADRGCHFPALENPELYVEEVRSFFRPLRPA